MTNQPAIQLTDLTRDFGRRGGTSERVRAVDGVDLTIQPGEVVALLGPNGAGKTTTIDLLLGLIAPSSGSAGLFGDEPVRAVERGRVAAVMQTGGLLPRLTVGETLELVADLHGRLPDVPEVARRAGVDGILRRRVVKCSGGQQQRLRFALALLPDPDLLVLDEPTAGMDVSGRRAFWAAIRDDLARRPDRTVLFATHYLAEADEMADRIVLMSGGRIVADDTPAGIKATALARRVRAEVGPEVDEALRALPGVLELTRLGRTLDIRTTDSDALARHLFAHTNACDVEIAAEALDDAVVALTSGGSR
ncbi:ABC-2 type transport system ATP-binding protein [Kineosphaera limosa]|nr:ABC transporter ATP-binding protein [Kineosphaera limosa]NYE00566.1 ABC-2 type transport system ATP-binding protein [Kineosphaera limosa]